MIGRHGGMPCHEVVETRYPRLPGMRSLYRLRKLHLVADKYDVARAQRHCREVCQADLTRFIDKQIVERLVECQWRKGQR